MPRWAPPSFGSRWVVSGLTAALPFTTSVARAQETAHPEAKAAAAPVVPGQAALERARAASVKGEYDLAEPLYVAAIEAGGLAPADVLEAYVSLGSARSVLGKKTSALSAFKSAAQLDAHFHVPPEAGKRAVLLAAQARRLEAKLGPVALHAQAPDSIAPRSAVTVDVTLDARHAALPGAQLGIYATEPGSGASHEAFVRSTPSAHFELPRELSLPSATLHVQVDWLDIHKNRLATAEEQIHVQPLPTPPPSATPVPLVLTADPRDATRSGEAEGPLPDGSRHGTGFWHTAWPYILGGVALAAGGAAVYFATRSGDDVNLSGVRVVTH